MVMLDRPISIAILGSIDCVGWLGETYLQPQLRLEVLLQPVSKTPHDLVDVWADDAVYLDFCRIYRH